MTADPDAVTQPNDTTDAGATLPRASRTPLRARTIGEAPAAGRPDRDAAAAALERRLLEGTERRLTIVVGGAGFGKSTLAARVAAARPTAWYTLDASDRHIGALAAGVTRRSGCACPRSRTTCRTRSRARSTRPTTRPSCAGAGCRRARHRRAPVGRRTATCPRPRRPPRPTCATGSRSVRRGPARLDNRSVSRYCTFNDC